MARDWTSSLPATVTLHVGESTVVPLPSALGGAYHWRATLVEGVGIAAAEVARGPVPDPGNPPSNTTAREFVRLSGRAAGRARLRLQIARFGREGEPEATHDIEMEVR